MKKKPIITLGSPYGIGYEIFILSRQRNNQISDRGLVVIGSKRIFDFFLKLLNTSIDIKIIESHEVTEESITDKSDIFINIDLSNQNITELSDITTKIDGKIALDSINYAAQYIEKGLFSSMVTLPVSKENINLIDKSFKGHTEYLLKLWCEDNVYMSFISDKLNIILITTHIPLSAVPESINKKSVTDCILYADKLLKKLKITKPICLLGLNPHAGENGLLGSEELAMKEAVKEMSSKSINITGPLPADTAFIPSNIDKYGIFIACYHDQGLIPFKMLAFDKGVNLSFGMKYIRTSVDHGTAADLIGTKKADISSFIEAYLLAERLCAD